jgi:hypothetical protein
MRSGHKDRSRRENAVAPGTTTTVAYGLGLVGWWKHDEGAGTTAADLSPSGNTTRLVNVDPAKCWVEGRQGKALHFDGEESYVEIPDSASLRAVQESDYTLAAWVKPEGALRSWDPAYDARYGIITKRGGASLRRGALAHRHRQPWCRCGPPLADEGNHQRRENLQQAAGG